MAPPSQRSLLLLIRTAFAQSASRSCRFSRHLQPLAPASRLIHTSPPPPHKTMPHYRLSFTCGHCDEASLHHVSQQGYHHGSVLITCPGCRNRHLLSDHLDIFSAGGLVSLAEVMGKHGRLVKYGALGDDGKLEFWPDGGKMGDDGGVGISGADVSGRTDREKGAEDGVEKDGANAGLASELDGDEEEEGFDEDDDVEDYIPHPPSRG